MDGQSYHAGNDLYCGARNQPHKDGEEPLIGDRASDNGESAQIVGRHGRSILAIASAQPCQQVAARPIRHAITDGYAHGQLGHLEEASHDLKSYLERALSDDPRYERARLAVADLGAVRNPFTS